MRDFSGNYYDLKRTFMLFSAVLLLVTLPGVSVKESGNFGFLTIAGIGVSALRFCVFSAATYYLLAYLLVWKIEGRVTIFGSGSSLKELHDVIALAVSDLKTMQADGNILVDAAMGEEQAEQFASRVHHRTFNKARVDNVPYSKEDIDASLQEAIGRQTKVREDIIVSVRKFSDECDRLLNSTQRLKADRGIAYLIDILAPGFLYFCAAYHFLRTAWPWLPTPFYFLPS